jgi:hypothetical protein
VIAPELLGLWRVLAGEPGPCVLARCDMCGKPFNPLLGPCGGDMCPRCLHDCDEPHRATSEPCRPRAMRCPLTRPRLVAPALAPRTLTRPRLAPVPLLVGAA